MTDENCGLVQRHKYIFIGQAPSRETDGKPPFVGKCGAFLAGLMGLSQDEMLSQHEFINLLPRWPGKGVNGDLFPIIQARAAAKKLLPSLFGRRVILLGSNVARAFGATSFQYYAGPYEVHDLEDSNKITIPWLVVIPHPSGVNRHWNNPTSRDVARKFFVEILRPQL